MRLVKREAKLLPDEGQVEELAVICNQQGELFNLCSEAGQVLPLHVDARLLAIVQTDHCDVGPPKRDPSGFNVQVGDALHKLRVQAPLQGGRELLGGVARLASLQGAHGPLQLNTNQVKVPRAESGSAG